jgi:hypothetical protein
MRGLLIARSPLGLLVTRNVFLLLLTTTDELLLLLTHTCFARVRMHTGWWQLCDTGSCTQAKTQGSRGQKATSQSSPPPRMSRPLLFKFNWINAMDLSPLREIAQCQIIFALYLSLLMKT